MARRGQGGLVWSSDHGEMCPRCQNARRECCCFQKPGAPPQSDGFVRISRETKGRKGKGVTLVSGLPLATAELSKLAKELKKKCGCGGTLKDGVVEIQGDHRDRLTELLTEKGYRVKRVGA